MKKLLLFFCMANSLVAKAGSLYETKALVFQTGADIAEALQFLGKDRCFAGELENKAQQIKQMRQQGKQLVRLASKIVEHQENWYVDLQLEISFFYSDRNGMEVVLPFSCSKTRIGHSTANYFESDIREYKVESIATLLTDHIQKQAEAILAMSAGDRVAGMRWDNERDKIYFEHTTKLLESIVGRTFANSADAAQTILNLVDEGRNDTFEDVDADLKAYHRQKSFTHPKILTFRALRKAVAQLQKQDRFKSYTSEQLVNEISIQHSVIKAN